MVASPFLLALRPVYHLDIIRYTAQARKVVKQVSIGEKRY